MQFARISDTLSAADAPELTENGTIRLRYTVDGREYLKELSTVVRAGDRPASTLMLWYDPTDPGRATDKGISWLGLGVAVAALTAVAAGLV